MTTVKAIRRSLVVLPAAALLFAITKPCGADVAPPPPPGSLPAGYCSTIYGELSSSLQGFNQLLATPPTWTLPPGGPAIYAANLAVADGNAGPQLSSSNYINGVLIQLEAEKALGVQAVVVQVGFPVLYAPFLGGQQQLAPYQAFYQQVAQAVRSLGLKLIVENDVLLANDIQAGWTNLT